MEIVTGKNLTVQFERCFLLVESAVDSPKASKHVEPAPLHGLVFSFMPTPCQL